MHQRVMNTALGDRVKHLTHLPSYRKMGIYLAIKPWISSLALMDFASIFHDFVQSCALYIVAATF